VKREAEKEKEAYDADDDSDDDGGGLWCGAVVMLSVLCHAYVCVCV
jgi:hypothetical protein